MEKFSSLVFKRNFKNIWSLSRLLNCGSFVVMHHFYLYFGEVIVEYCGQAAKQGSDTDIALQVGNACNHSSGGSVTETVARFVQLHSMM